MPDLTFISSESWEVLVHEMLVEYPADGTVQSGWWRHIRSNRSVWQYADSALGTVEDVGWKPFHPPAYIEALTEHHDRLLRHIVFTTTVLLFPRIGLCFLYLNYETYSGVQIKEDDIGSAFVTLCGQQKCTYSVRLQIWVNVRTILKWIITDQISKSGAWTTRREYNVRCSQETLNVYRLDKTKDNWG